MLVTAAMARVPSELRSAEPHLVSDADLVRLARRVQSEFGVNESLARWSVATWAFALGIPPSQPGLGSPVTDELTPNAPPATDRYPVSREGLLAAIRDAKSDGVVSPEERESLRQLAGRVRLQLGDEALLPKETRASRRWMIPGVVGGVAVLAVLVAIIVRGDSEDPSAPARATQLSQPAPVPAGDDSTKAERLRALARFREQAKTSRERLAALRDSHAAARVETQAFADRLRRAARQARDQSRDTFGMAGRTYTQPLAEETLAYTETYVAERKLDEAAIGSELGRLDQLIRQVDASPDEVDLNRLVASTLPAHEVPVFQVGTR